MKRRVFLTAVLVIILVFSMIVFVACNVGSADENELIEYTLTVNDGTGSGTFQKGTSVTATAEVPQGKIFSHWERNGAFHQHAGNPYTFKIYEDIDLTPIFVNLPSPPAKYYSYLIDGGRRDGVSKGGSAKENAVITIVANEPPINKQFSCWKDGDTIVSTENQYTFTLTKDIKLTAVFEDEFDTLLFYPFERVDDNDDLCVYAYAVAGIGTVAGSEIVIPETYRGKPVTHIFNAVFKNNQNITSVTIGDNVTSIYNEAFYGCSGLKKITIGRNVTNVGVEAFYGCTSLTELNYNAVAAESFTHMAPLPPSQDPSEGVVTTNSRVFLNAGIDGEGITVNIGANVTELPFNFLSPKNNWPADNVIKIKSVNFAEGSVCESIGMYAFNNCKGLTDIKIPNSVKEIGSAAFQNCLDLKTVTIGSGIKDIYFNAFGDVRLIENGFTNTTLSSITMLATFPPSFDEYDRSFLPDVKIYVPKGCANAYGNAEGWSQYKYQIFELD